MSDYKTPGVYIQEKSVLSGTISAVETAIPAFIGYTEEGFPVRTGEDGALVLGDIIAVKLQSMDEFVRSFGNAPITQCDLTPAIQLMKYYLYRSMEMFYRNGGGECYVTSVGSYSDPIDKEELQLGITKLEKYEDPTMVVIPDAIALGSVADGGGDCYEVQQAMVNHCKEMQNRVAILDVWGAYEKSEDHITNFRNNINQNLEYSAAYYPWLNTTAFSLADVGYNNVQGSDLSRLQENLCNTDEAQGITYNATAVKLDNKNLESLYSLIGKVQPIWIKDTTKIEVKKDDGTGYDDKTDDIKISFAQELFRDFPDFVEQKTAYTKASEINDITKANEVMGLIFPYNSNTNNVLTSTFSYYCDLLTDIQTQLNLLPPSAVMAGVYTYVDNTSGVGQAPANYGVSGVQSPNGPTVIITNKSQQDLNLPLNGKALNAIRYFKGKGTLIWGARTLLGNSGDWRYVNVRRSVIMIETSIRLALDAYVFSPNTLATWIDLQTQITAFLVKQWNAGILVGSSQDQAFQVDVGIGTTMTSQDVIDGIMKISVKLAVTRPAEFIEVTFQQMMPTA